MSEQAKKRMGEILWRFQQEKKVGNDGVMDLELILKDTVNDFYDTWNNAVLHGTGQCALDIHNIWKPKWFGEKK